MKEIRASLEEISEATGVEYPNPRPHTLIDFVAVAWNEEKRAADLLALARAWFSALVIGVQESSDHTLAIVREIASRPTDQIFEHPHHGYGDASMPELVHATHAPWVFVVAFDELPDLALLRSLASATAYADKMDFDALWVPFESIVEGIAYEEQHGHLRLFRRSLGWPATMHSRVESNNEAWWPHGKIVHTRSLDEMMRDYLRYYAVGRGNSGWESHNIRMMHDACVSVAAKHGWTYVMHYDWWKEVRKLAFTKEELDGFRSES